MPTSFRALSLLALAGGSERWARSTTLLFFKSFDPRGFMNYSILCRLFSEYLASDFQEIGFSCAAQSKHRPCHDISRRLSLREIKRARKNE